MLRRIALGSIYLFMCRFDDSLAEFELALRRHSSFSSARGLYASRLFSVLRPRLRAGDPPEKFASNVRRDRRKRIARRKVFSGRGLKVESIRASPRIGLVSSD
jgi:hypothetical protein